MKTLYDLLGAVLMMMLRFSRLHLAKPPRQITLSRKPMKSFAMPSQRATYDGCCGSHVSGFENASEGTNDDTRHDLLLFTAFPAHRHCERVHRLG
jgi:hypothetical protein